MQDEKSQLQNREKALRVLRARLYDRALAEQQAELAADRRAQVGTGDRAEKIRTYNFPERRVTDHRVKVTVHDLDRVLEGELDEFTAALEADEKRRRLAAQAERPDRGARRGARPRRRARSRRAGLRGRRDLGVRQRHRAARCRAAAGARSGRLARARSSWSPRRLVAGTAIRQFQDLVRRRSAGHEPVAYLLGRKGFRHIELEVDRRVLVPRPETELLVEIALDLPAGARVIDVGTGSGAVALALACERPDLEVTGSDASADALAVATANRERLGLSVPLVQADLLDGLGADWDAILSNPPYVADADAARLQRDVADHEPQSALFAGADGLDVIRGLVPQAAATRRRAAGDRGRGGAGPGRHRARPLRRVHRRDLGA